MRVSKISVTAVLLGVAIVQLSQQAVAQRYYLDDAKDLARAGVDEETAPVAGPDRGAQHTQVVLDPRPLAEASADNATLVANGKVIEPGAGGDPGHRFPCAAAPAAAVVADTVLLPIGDVGVAGAKLLDDIAVVF